MLLYMQIIRIFGTWSYCFSKSRRSAIKKGESLQMCRRIDVNPFFLYSIKGFIPSMGARYARPPKIPHYDNYCR